MNIQAKTALRQDIKGAVIGMVLGDSCIELRQGRFGRLLMEHKADKLEYVAWKAAILEDLCSVDYGTKDYPNGKGFVQGAYQTAWLNTKFHPLFTKLHSRAYYQGRKTVDKHLIKCLSDLGLAIWFMDDGSLKYKHSNEALRLVSLKSWEVVFATHCFSHAENLILAQAVYRRFGLVMRPQRQNQYWFLALAAKSQDEFWKLVGPHISQVECMHYKLPPAVLGQYRAEPVREGVETMYQPPALTG